MTKLPYVGIFVLVTLILGTAIQGSPIGNNSNKFTMPDEEEVADFRDQMADIKRDVRTVRGHAVDIKGEMKKIQGANVRLEDGLKQTRSEVKDLNSQSQGANARHEDGVKQIRSDITDLNSQIAQLQTVLKSLLPNLPGVGSLNLAKKKPSI